MKIQITDNFISNIHEHIDQILSIFIYHKNKIHILIMKTWIYKFLSHDSSQRWNCGINYDQQNIRYVKCCFSINDILESQWNNNFKHISKTYNKLMTLILLITSISHLIFNRNTCSRRNVIWRTQNPSKHENINCV